MCPWKNLRHSSLRLSPVGQNEAADRMGVFRKSFWNNIQNIRQNANDALVNENVIETSGGEYLKKDAGDRLRKRILKLRGFHASMHRPDINIYLM